MNFNGKVLSIPIPAEVPQWQKRTSAYRSTEGKITQALKGPGRQLALAEQLSVKMIENHT
jgi:hypothetical protein